MTFTFRSPDTQQPILSVHVSHYEMALSYLCDDLNLNETRVREVSGYDDERGDFVTVLYDAAPVAVVQV